MREGNETIRKQKQIQNNKPKQNTKTNHQNKHPPTTTEKKSLIPQIEQNKGPTYSGKRHVQDGRILVYRTFDLWSHTGPFDRATVVVHQVMLPDEILWRIALHWPDLGHDWNRVGWHLVSSCLPDLISPYVLVMQGLLGYMAHRPLDSWRSPVVMLVMSAPQHCPRELISRSCRSCSMPSVDEVGQW